MGKIHSIMLRKQILVGPASDNPNDAMRSTSFVQPLRKELYALISQITLGEQNAELQLDELAVQDRTGNIVERYVHVDIDIRGKYDTSNIGKLLVARIMTLGRIEDNILSSLLDQSRPEWLSSALVIIASYKSLFQEHRPSNLEYRNKNTISEDQKARHAWIATLLADEVQKSELRFERRPKSRLTQDHNGHIRFINTITHLIGLMNDISRALGICPKDLGLPFIIHRFDSNLFFKLYYGDEVLSATPSLTWATDMIETIRPASSMDGEVDSDFKTRQSRRANYARRNNHTRGRGRR